MTFNVRGGGNGPLHGDALHFRPPTVNNRSTEYSAFSGRWRGVGWLHASLVTQWWARDASAVSPRGKHILNNADNSQRERAF
eukprot:350853-Chlamydomonas_euryale.AAC.3